jgi:hypothetical protein
MAYICQRVANTPLPPYLLRVIGYPLEQLAVDIGLPLEIFAGGQTFCNTSREPRSYNKKNYEANNSFKLSVVRLQNRALSVHVTYRPSQSRETVPLISQ